MILQLNKPVGKSPLDMIKEYKHNHPDQKDVPMTYAGRLDPMAEGLLLILTAEDVHRKDEFLGLDKTYEAQILLGASTDTGDILGMVQESEQVLAIKDFDLAFLVGEHELEIPHYSSYKVNGRPLWHYARAGEKVPVIKKMMIVRNAVFEGTGSVSLEDIINSIKKVRGDFRQEEIISSWKQVDHKNFSVLRMSFNVSSGTYIRSLASVVGDRLKIPATLFSLKRTKIGNYHLQKNHAS